MREVDCLVAGSILEDDAIAIRRRSRLVLAVNEHEVVQGDIVHRRVGDERVARLRDAAALKVEHVVFASIAANEIDVFARGFAPEPERLARLEGRLFRGRLRDALLVDGHRSIPVAVVLALPHPERAGFGFVGMDRVTAADAERIDDIGNSDFDFVRAVDGHREPRRNSHGVRKCA